MKNLDVDLNEEFKKYLEQNDCHKEIKKLILTEIKSAYVAGWISAAEKFYNEQYKYKV